MNYRIFPPQRVVGDISLPASKSISNRVLLIRSLCDRPFEIVNLAQCDDTRVMERALTAKQPTRVDVGAAGTAMRFLTAFFAMQEGRQVTIDGNDRMRHRPVGVLVDALRQLGACVDYEECEGFPPLKITGRKLQGGRLEMPGDVSSQFISAILLIAPVIGGVELHITGEITSRPYIDMTLGLMGEFGVEAHWTENQTIVVPAGQYVGFKWVVEADWSAASYWFALQAVLPESRITLNGLLPESLQGDSRIATVMAQMKVACHWRGTQLELETARQACCCCSNFADMNGTPDIAPTIVVAECLLGRPFRITGLKSLRIKESDRLEAMRQELGKLGFALKIEADDAVSWHFETIEPANDVSIDTHGDHRMAMALAVAAVRFPGIIIEKAEVVNKSYPDFWLHLRQCGFSITQA